jgi:hypothetical protein
MPKIPFFICFNFNNLVFLNLWDSLLFQSSLLSQNPCVLIFDKFGRKKTLIIFWDSSI